jgi:HK97 family phage major capsid protein
VALDRALLSDFAELQAFLDRQLRLGVLLAEENQIINGNGTAPNLRGILNTPGILNQPLGADDRATAIYKAITAVRLGFFEPDGIVLHPRDWQDIRTMKDADGNYLAGTLIQADPDRMFGKVIVTSPVIAEGTALVGAFAEGAIVVWDREEARVTFTETGLGDGAGTELFTRNQVRFRGEERIAFGVPRPSAFCSVTGI